MLMALFQDLKYSAIYDWGGDNTLPLSARVSLCGENGHFTTANHVMGRLGPSLKEAHTDAENVLEERIRKIGIELATFELFGIMKPFGSEYLGRFKRERAYVPSEDLKHYSLVQFHTRAFQDCGYARAGSDVWVDAPYCLFIRHKDTDFAVMALNGPYWNNAGVVISQFQGVSNPEGNNNEDMHRGRFKWTHAFTHFTLDWAYQLGMPYVTIVSAKNKRSIRRTHARLVDNGFPETDLEKSMRMKPEEQRDMVIRLMGKESVKEGNLHLPAEGFLMYDITARRTRWRGKKFQTDGSGDYIMSILD